MIETMKMTVMTPTLTPRIVNAERNLFARKVSKAISADSLMSSSHGIVSENHVRSNRSFTAY